jgi:phosphate transport system substrate-binding protein
MLFAGVLAATFAAFLMVACGGDDEKPSPTPESTAAAQPTTADSSEELSGTIVGDGSSTVFPISEAVAEEFRKVEPDVDVVVGISGTGGGFQKFCAGDTDFSDASRPIKDEEAQACADNGIGYEEFQVAYDGLSVMVNPANDFVDCMTVDELKLMWEPDSAVDGWNDVRPEWPDQPIALYGPGTDSGTFDYFTDVIVGEEGASRPDYTASEDDNVLVQGIADDEDALGYFGYAYYVENTDKLKLVAVDGGEGCIAPSRETILDGTYSPLSRPIFVYVRKDLLEERPEVAEFMRFYLTEGPALVQEVGYVEAPDGVYEEGLALIP